MNEAIDNARPVTAPKNIVPASVDDKGRVKLPRPVKEYLLSLDDDRFWVTTLDLRMIRIYTMASWERNEAILESDTEDIEGAQDVLFIARYYGGEASIDRQGRALLPAELRRLLKVENQTLWIERDKDHLNLFGKEIYEEKRRRAMNNLTEKLRRQEKRGLK